MEHVPIMVNEILELVRGMPHPPRFFLDGTFGRGGHTRELLKAFPELKVVALDQDEDALTYGREHFQQELEQGKIFFFHGNFADIKKLRAAFEKEAGVTAFDGILLDLGVSSPQLDSAARGFSFYHEGPLDMRMDKSGEITAADIVNTWDEEDLVDLFFHYGEIRRPRRVVARIIEQRRKAAFSKTSELAELIARTEGWSRKGHHPATRFFLALRMKVNEELENLTAALPELVNSLSDGGRILVITFHSLEDRLAKVAFKGMSDRGYRVNKKVICPSREEQLKNPRSRSAKLRVFQRGIPHES